MLSAFGYAPLGFCVCLKTWALTTFILFIQEVVERLDEADDQVAEETQQSATSEAAKAAQDRAREANRVYQRELPREVADAISIRRQEWLHCIRCCYLATLNYNKAVKMVAPAFGDIGSVSANILTSHFRKRTMKNAANWQYQAIERAIVSCPAGRNLTSLPANTATGPRPQPHGRQVEPAFQRREEPEEAG